MSVQDGVRTERIDVRVSVQELTVLKVGAAAARMPLGTWLRKLGLEAGPVTEESVANEDFEDTLERENLTERTTETDDGECPFTPVQLSNRSGLPVAACRRAIERGTWANL